MKTILAASFGALMLAGSITAAQAAAAVQVNPAPIAQTAIATPYTTGAAGSEALPAFDFTHATTVLSSPDPAASSAIDPPASSAAVDPPASADPVQAVSDPLGSGGSQAMTAFHLDSAVTLTPSVVGVAPISELDASTGVASLVNRSGGGR